MNRHRRADTMRDRVHAFVEKPKYTLRNIDPDVWRQVKERAEAEDRNVSAVLRAFLRVYARHGYRVIETFDGKERP